MAVYTGASFNLWEPDTGERYAFGSPQVIVAALSQKRVKQVRHSTSAFNGLSESWAANPDTLPLRFPRIAFRDIARATDTRTVLTALVPPNTPLVNTCPYLFRRSGGAREEAYLLGVLSSIPLDWFARRYVEMHLNLHIAKGLPIPRLDETAPSARIVEIAGLLSAVDARYATWASEVGVPVGSVADADTRRTLVCELDALVSLRFGLTRAQIELVFATFHRGWQFADRLASVLSWYDAWEGQQ